MSKQDRQGVRTATDLERKYDFGQLDAAQVSLATLQLSISQLSQSLSQYIVTTNAKIAELERTTLDDIDETLKIDPETNRLCVNTADVVEADNKLPVTSNAVALEIAKLLLKINALESLIDTSNLNAILGKAKLGTMILGKGA